MHNTFPCNLTEDDEYDHGEVGNLFTRQKASFVLMDQHFQLLAFSGFPQLRDTQKARELNEIIDIINRYMWIKNAKNNMSYCICLMLT